MRYPILVHQTDRDTVIAVCPITKGFSAKGKTLDEALHVLQQKFMCYLHDDNIQLEIVSLQNIYSRNGNLLQRYTKTSNER